MTLIEAIQATLFLAMMGGAKTATDAESMELAEGFILMNAGRLAQDYGGKVRELLTDGEADDAELGAFEALPDTPLNRGMRALLAAATEQARVSNDLQIEGVPVRAISAINLTCAFWLSHSADIETGMEAA